MVEEKCTTCRWYGGVNHIDPETKEVETKIWCCLAHCLMKNDKPCKLYQLSDFHAWKNNIY